MKLKLCLISSALTLLQITSASADNSTLQPRLILNGQTGSYSYSQADLLQPLWANNDSLFFINGSALAGTQSLQTYSLGLGYRQLINNDAILGGYSYFDYSQPIVSGANTAFFTQLTVGGEWLSNRWDFRTNAYIPVGNHTADTNIYSPIVFAHTVASRQDRIQITALNGADVEAGHSVGNIHNLHAYLGYYHYGLGDTSQINGARARLEYKLNNRFTFTATEQFDNNQHNEAFIGARITFGGTAAQHSTACQFDCLSDRMEDMVIRQPEVTTAKQSRIFITTDPRNYFYVNSAAPAGGNGTFEHPFQSMQQALAAANSNSVIYAFQGNYNLDGQINLQSGQSLAGSSSAYFFNGVKIFDANGTTTFNGSIHLAGNNTLGGFTLDGSNTGENIGIVGNGVSNVTISNVIITNFSGNAGFMTFNAGATGENAYGIQLTNSSNILLDNVTVSNINAGNGGAGTDTNFSGNNNSNVTSGNGNNGGNAIGIDLDGAQNAVITNTTVSNINGGSGGNGGTITDNGDNNTNNAGNGGAGGTATGISLSGSTNAQLKNTIVRNINAGAGGTGGNVVSNGDDNTNNGGTGGNGGAVTGINLSNSIHAILNAVTVNSVLAGSSTGGTTTGNNESAIQTGGNSSNGGAATGINLSSAQAPFIDNVSVSNVLGGNSTGGGAEQNNINESICCGNGGTSANGGNATGINLSNSTSATVNQVSISNITGGASQGGGAIVTNSTSSITLGGQSGAGGDATGLNLSNAQNGTVADISVTHISGGNATGGLATGTGVDNSNLTAGGGTAGNGGNATAVDLSNANTVALAQITISNITGGSSTGGVSSGIINGSNGDTLSLGGNSGNGGNAIGVNTTGAIHLNLDLPSFHFVSLTGGSAIAGASFAAGGDTAIASDGTAGTQGTASTITP